MSLVAKGHGTLPHTFLPFLLPLLGVAAKTIATTAITSLATNVVSNIINPPRATPTAGPAEAPLPSAEDVGLFEEEEEEFFEEEPEEFVDEEFMEPDVGAGPIGGTAPAPLEVPPILRAAVLSSPTAAVPFSRGFGLIGGRREI